MSYSYTLALTTPLSAEEAACLVGGLPGFERLTGGTAVGPGIVASIRPTDEEDKEFCRDYEGFEPDLSVSLTRKRGNRDDVLEADNVLQVTMRLLPHAAGAAVLRAEDVLWLRLEKGALWLNTEGGLWKYYQDLLPLVTLPYRAAALPDATLDATLGAPEGEPA